MKKVLTFLSEPFNTDELKARLEQTRDALHAKALLQTQLASELAIVEMDVMQVQGKSDYLMNLTGQTLDMFVPAPLDEVEMEFDRRKDEIYDPLKDAYTYGGAVGAGVWMMGSVLLPGAIKIVGFLARSKKIATLAKSAKLIKLAKIGKATVYLAVVIALLETALRMATAKKINDHLRKEQTKIEKQNREADQVLARYEVAIAQGRKLVQAFFDEVEVKDKAEYNRLMDEAIGEVAEQAAYSKMIRNMLRMGMDAERVATAAPIEIDAIRAIERRLNAELMLLEGQSREAVGKALQMTRYQVDLVARVLEVRADAMLGTDTDILITRHKVTDAVADLQTDIVEFGLVNLWTDVTGDGDPGTLAQTLLVEPASVAQLREEVRARSALLSGKSSEEVAEAHPSLDADRIAEMEAELELIRADVADSPLPAETLALEWRVTVSSIEAIAA